MTKAIPSLDNNKIPERINKYTYLLLARNAKDCLINTRSLCSSTILAISLYRTLKFPSILATVLVCIVPGVCVLPEGLLFPKCHTNFIACSYRPKNIDSDAKPTRVMAKLKILPHKINNGPNLFTSSRDTGHDR